ncbi:nuclear pore membrane glycoprotein 210-like [Hypomesus transpacificus]|uniref:nuclear pore membrane glycoprotein 210-like n=1 Tax=Hypomesus transpacificus TaxID=137520 RepID=UPI001F071E87|nr:nuclear pore membrane glycoprotein 210-like [Hypomesus transpacificus]
MLSALRFHSESPFLLLSEPSQSEHDSVLLVLSIDPSTSWMEGQGLPRPVNVTVYNRLTPQTHVVTVTFVTDNRVEKGGTDLIRLESGPLLQLVDFQLILTFAVFAVLVTTAALFIVYNTILSRLQTGPVVYMPSSPPATSVAPCRQTVCFSPWIRMSSAGADRAVRRRHWLWSSR